MQNQLINFLQEEVGISTDAINVALRNIGPTPSQLPMLLWQYGLISLSQLEQVFDWQETSFSALP